VVRIGGVTPAAFEAICAGLPIGSTAHEPDLDQKGERLIWLEDAMADRLAVMRRPGESYSDVILRIAERGDAEYHGRAG
jgi:hypothetical protein